MPPPRSLGTYLSDFCRHCFERSGLHDIDGVAIKCMFQPTDWEPCTEADFQHLNGTPRRTIARDLTADVEADFAADLSANPKGMTETCRHYGKILQRLRKEASTADP